MRVGLRKQSCLHGVCVCVCVCTLHYWVFKMDEVCFSQSYSRLLISSRTGNALVCFFLSVMKENEQIKPSEAVHSKLMQMWLEIVTENQAAGFRIPTGTAAESDQWTSCKP